MAAHNPDFTACKRADIIKIIEIGLFIVKRLQAEHYKVLTADNGQECLIKALRESPDLILLDIMMPRLDGIATLLKLRAIDDTKTIPVIICSAVDKKEDEIVAANLKVVGYLTKPIDLAVMLDKIRGVIG